MERSLAEIAHIVHGTVEGNAQTPVKGIADISFAKEGDIVFAESAAWLDKAETTPASAVIINTSMPAKNKPVIRVANPKLAFGMLMHLYGRKQEFKPGIHETAVIGQNVTIGEGVSVQPYAVIQDNVTIGDKTVIGSFCCIGEHSTIGASCMLNPGVTVYPHSTIGNKVILHAGVVIGSDGFGYVEQDGKRIKIPQIGTVVIEDDVEIGANTTIDCATLGKTIIGKGTKIDNLVQIAHNDVVGQNCIFCAQSGVSGSCVIGNNVIIAGQAGLADHVTVEDNVIIGAQAGVPTNKIIRANQMVFGAPARSAKDTKRQMGAQARLPQLFDRVKQLETELNALKEQIGESVPANSNK